MRTRFSTGLLLILGGLAVGCQGQTPATPISADLPVAPALSAQNQEWGNVDLTIVWPQRTQAIPLSANSMYIQAFNSMGREILNTLVRRADGTEAMNYVSLRLPTGTYTIEARAYRESSYSSANVPVAVGSAFNVSIYTNLKTKLSMALDAQAPRAGAFSATVGAPGSTFTIDTVTYFERPVVSGDTIEVWFGSSTNGGSNFVPIIMATSKILSRRVTPSPLPNPGWETGLNLTQLVDAEQDMLEVTVPTGLQGTCYVAVKVDGIFKAAPFTAFEVVDRLAFLTGAAPVTRAVGETYNAKGDLRGFPLEDVTTLMSFPQLTWTSSAPGTAFVTQNGTVYAYKPGTATITARSGNRTASYTMIVTDRHSTASIDVAVPDLYQGTVGFDLAVPEYTGEDTGTVTHQP